MWRSEFGRVAARPSPFPHRLPVVWMLARWSSSTARFRGCTWILSWCGSAGAARTRRKDRIRFSGVGREYVERGRCLYGFYPQKSCWRRFWQLFGHDIGLGEIIGAWRAFLGVLWITIFLPVVVFRSGRFPWLNSARSSPVNFSGSGSSSWRKGHSCKYAVLSFLGVTEKRVTPHIHSFTSSKLKNSTPARLPAIGKVGQ